MRRILYENGLSLAMFGLFVICLAGQSISGWLVYCNEQEDHRSPPSDYLSYLVNGHFTESIFENWESEFLQMGAYVVLTVFLRQKGSAESKKLGKKEPVDTDPERAPHSKDAPWPVRRGGLMLRVYEVSLSLALFLLFFVSLTLHALGGQKAYNHEQLQHGSEQVSVLQYLGTSQFWFESFQNWQSEFLSVGVLIVLSIFLRQKGSSQSKPVHFPHSETGKE
jgi:hypothetical protein